MVLFLMLINNTYCIPNERTKEKNKTNQREKVMILVVTELLLLLSCLAISVKIMSKALNT